MCERKNNERYNLRIKRKTERERVRKNGNRNEEKEYIHRNVHDIHKKVETRIRERKK